MKKFKNQIERRVTRMSPYVFDILRETGQHIESFRIAGNSLNKELSDISDIDVFVCDPQDYRDICHMEISDDTCFKLVSETNNALTFKFDDGTVVQICAYFHDSLQDLVNSFDFAHIQVGAEVTFDWYEVEELAESVSSSFAFQKVKDIAIDTCCTDEYMNAKMVGNSWYVSRPDLKNSYPLSSLFRLMKYIFKDELSGIEKNISLVSIFADILERGFDDYEDFKDQLDSIDLLVLVEVMGLSSDEEQEEFLNALSVIFNKLSKNKDKPAFLMEEPDDIDEFLSRMVSQK